MHTKAIAYLLIILIIFSSTFIVAKTLNAQQKGSSTETSELSAKLAQVIQNQQLIISKLNEIKEELNIIKVRTAIRR